MAMNDFYLSLIPVRCPGMVFEKYSLDSIFLRPTLFIISQYLILEHKKQEKKYNSRVFHKN